MYFSGFLAAVLGISSVAAVSNPHRKAPKKPTFELRDVPKRESSAGEKRANSNHLNSKTKKFAVDGTAIPDVNFDIGESYAGTLSINDNPDAANQLWFWYFPSENPAASNEIVIWLNGGPGCSSLDGLFNENGPFLWQPGTYRPFKNPYSWVNLTNMVWVDQPIGTGFSPAAKGAPPKIKNENDVDDDFMGFWKNFMETFDLTGRDVYITGESYAGQYIPYLAHNMLKTGNKKYYNVKGIQINDPSINEDNIMEEAPAVWHVNAYDGVFALNQTTMDWLNEQNTKCGYDEWMRTALTYPPAGPIPAAPDPTSTDCKLWEYIISAALYVNPCFNIYHITDFCPYLWNNLGFPGFGWGPSNYFNRTDVKKAINANPDTNYAICGDDSLGLLHDGGDQSVPSALGPLPKVIEMTNNVVIGHGWLDFILLVNGTLATIQNMTWNGAQGFQSPPTEQFYVPYHPDAAEIVHDTFYQPIPAPTFTNMAGSGYLGTTHHERGLTFVSVDLAGHQIPQYVQGAAYRQLEFLLGRISSLTEISDFTTQHGNYTGHSDVPY